MDNVEKVDLDRVDWKSSREFFESLGEALDKLDDKDESYNFTWVGKRKSIVEAGAPINKTLRPDIEASKKFNDTKNMLIVGNNLDALKILQESYLNKIKMIYIDPPYNTGDDRLYEDDFRINMADYKDSSLDENGNSLVADDGFITNSKTSSRYHSRWLSIMYPLLKLSRTLLTDDGVIFISIDDDEYSNLKKLCDEIYGEDNFIATIVRNTNSSKNQSLFVSVSHEYCLIYSRNIEQLKQKHADDKWSVPKNNIKEYLQKVKQLKDEGLSNDEISEELKILTKYPRFIDFTNYWYFDERGLYRKDNIGGVKNGNMTPLHNPLTGTDDPLPPGGYRYSTEKLQKMVENNEIHFHTDGSLPAVKRYLDDYNEQRPKSIMSDDQRPDYSMLKEFGCPFDNPKQLAFIDRLEYIMDKDSIILDFFAGSGTTAHAAMDLNAQDGGSRQFILVQYPEACKPGSDAAKAGFKTIDEITKRRLDCAGKKILNERPGVAIDDGYRVFNIDDSNENDNISKPLGEINQTDIFDSVDNIKKDRTPLDLLFGVVYASALPFDLKLETRKIGDNTVYLYGYLDEGTGLVACFDNDISEDTIKEIAKMKSLTAAFKDSSFTDSAAKINLSEQFRVISPDTKVKVI